jgi:hypothetical protein
LYGCILKVGDIWQSIEKKHLLEGKEMTAEMNIVAISIAENKMWLLMKKGVLR